MFKLFLLSLCCLSFSLYSEEAIQPEKKKLESFPTEPPKEMPPAQGKVTRVEKPSEQSVTYETEMGDVTFYVKGMDQASQWKRDWEKQQHKKSKKDRRHSSGDNESQVGFSISWSLD